MALFDPISRRRHRAGEQPSHQRIEEFPTDPAERFEARVVQMMDATGRDRTWCRQRVRERFPHEAEAHSSASSV